MSILLRSPPELGGIVVLFCKGADSAMLDPDVCSGSENLKHYQLFQLVPSICYFLHTHLEKLPLPLCIYDSIHQMKALNLCGVHSL